MTSTDFDLIVIGSGVMGTFHAWHAARLGKKVLLLEKDSYPQQATVRNFGQVVPSGMPADWFEFGVRSSQIYEEIQSKVDISVRNNGSVYIASNQPEQQLLHELKSIMEARNYTSELLTQQQCLQRWRNLNTAYCLEGLFFPQEISVEPEWMIHRLLEYANTLPNFSYQPNTTVITCMPETHRVIVETHNHQRYTSGKVIVCNGGDFKLLFADLFKNSGIVISKLQMLRTVPLPHINLKGNILTGLTIRRYESFAECPSFQTLKTPTELIELKKWGIHILFKQALDGSIIVGDSHEYASVKNIDSLGFSINESINQLILQEASKILRCELPIASTWAGFYSQHPNKGIVNIDIEDKIHIRTAIGGKGMTSAAGYAEDSIRKLLG